MEKAINKLGLTEEDRAITYTNNGATKIAEIRHYDPVMGLLKIVDPMSGETHELMYNHDFKRWFKPGTDIVCTYNACLLYTSPSPRDQALSRMPSSA